MLAPTAYLDTCVVSGLAKGDLEQNEITALFSILEARRNGLVELVASPVVEREISRIPEQHRTPHSAIYALLKEIPLVPAFRKTPPFSPLDFPFGVRPERLLMLLNNVLPDEEDAAHVYQAAKSGIKYVITADVKTMLSRSAEVSRLCGVQLLKPTEFVRTVLDYL